MRLRSNRATLLNLISTTPNRPNGPSMCSPLGSPAWWLALVHPILQRGRPESLSIQALSQSMNGLGLISQEKCSLKILMRKLITSDHSKFIIPAAGHGSRFRSHMLFGHSRTIVTKIAVKFLRCCFLPLVFQISLPSGLGPPNHPCGQTSKSDLVWDSLPPRIHKCRTS